LSDNCLECHRDIFDCGCNEPTLVSYTLSNEPDKVEAPVIPPKIQLLKYMEILNKKIVISQNDNTQVYACIAEKNYVLNFEMHSRRYQEFIKIRFYKSEKVLFADDVYKSACDTAASLAVFNENTQRVQTHVRIAQLEDSIYYDLATPDRKAIKMTKEKVEMTHLSLNDPVFVNSARTAPQVMPELMITGQGIPELMNLIRIIPEQQELFKVHLVCLMLESAPVPLMSFVDEMGQGKTTLSGTIKIIIDPQSDVIVDNVSKLPKNGVDRIVSFSQKYLHVFDNLSHITPEESDDVCRAVTGSSNEKRKLFSDEDLIVATYKRKFVLNGIGLSVDRGDFIQRTVQYKLTPLTPETMMSNKQYNEKIQKIRPFVLADIFNLMSRSLKMYENVEEELQGKLPRMSDFAIWGECISRCIGNKPGEFLKSYNKTMADSTNEAAENHGIVAYILERMRGVDSLTEDLTTFYAKASQWAEENYFDTKGKFSTFPKASNKLRPTFQRVNPYLKNYGYVATITDRDYSTTSKRSVKIDLIKSHKQRTLSGGQGTGSSGLSAPIPNTPNTIGNLRGHNDTDKVKDRGENQ